MKRFWIGLLLVSLLGFNYANVSDVDSLRKLLKQAETFEKIDILISIGNIYFDQNTDSSSFYLNKAYYLAKESQNDRLIAITSKNLGIFNNKLNNNERSLSYLEKALIILNELNNKAEVALIQNEIGRVYFKLNNYQKAQEYFNYSFNNYSELNMPLHIGYASQNIGKVYFEWGNYEKALINYKKALTLFENEENDGGIASVLNDIGKIHYYWSNYQQALDYYQKALILYDSINNNQGRGITFANIGEIYYAIDDYNKAIEFYSRGLTLSEEYGDEIDVANLYNQLGNVYYFKKEFDTALEYYNDALKKHELLENKKGIAFEYNNIGLVLSEQGNYNEAIRYFKKSLSIKEKLGNTQGVANSYNNIGDLFFSKGDFSKAILYYNKSIGLSSELKSKFLLEGSYKGLYKTYALLGEYKKAFEYLLLFKEMSDSLYTENSQKQLLEFQTQFEIDKKEKEIRLLSKDKELQEAQIKRYKVFRNSLIVFSLLIVLSVFLLYSRYVLKRKINIKLEQEIKERNKIESDLRQSKEFIESIISNAKDGIAVIDLDGNYIKVNEALCKMLQYPKKELEKKKLNDITPKKWHEQDIQALKNLKIGIHIDSYEKEYVTHDGKVFPVSVSASLIKDENDVPNSIVVIINDITERKISEEELNKYKNHLEKLVDERTRDYEIAKSKAVQSDKLKSAFLANMSHEIRTPMNTIIGFTDLLADPDLTSDQKEEFIELINSSGNNLLQLIDDIIDLSKIEANQLTISETEVDIHKMLRELHAYYNKIKKRKEYQKEAIIIDLHVDNIDKPNYILTDNNRFRQVFNNLINNALKFTEKGKIEFGYKDISNGYINFFVKDTGVGLNKESQTLIFERFWKMDKANSQIYSGTGLGLTITKSFIELLDGKIWVDSEPGVGSTFYFSIPYKPVQKKPKPQVVKEVKRNYEWPNKTVLIVEDEKTNYLFLNEALSRTKAAVLWAQNGIEAIDICKGKLKIDLILMDMKMPEMDGYEATKKIKILDNSIPIIAQTAYAMVGEEERSYEAGCDDYITKPIKLKILLETIAKHI